jgi:transposase
MARVQWPEGSQEILKQAFKHAKNYRTKTRLWTLWQLTEGKSKEQVAKELQMSSRAITHWIRGYKEEGAKGLEDRPHPGRTPRLKQEEAAELRQLARAGQIRSLKQGCQVVLERFGQAYSVHGLWQRFEAIGLSWKVGRKSHVKANKEKQEAFQKGG